MESYVSFDFLHGLMNVPVEHCHRAKFLQVRQGLCAIVSSPAPLRIHRPERNMRENHDWRAVLQVLQIVFHPLKLLASERAQAAGLEVHHIDQADEVGSVFIEAVPALSSRLFGVSLAEHGSVIV